MQRFFWALRSALFFLFLVMFVIALIVGGRVTRDVV